jgi:hypothetical protein
MGTPGTPFPDGQTPSTSKWLSPNKGKLDNSGQSGGVGPKKGGGMGAGAPMSAPAPAAPPPAPPAK